MSAATAWAGAGDMLLQTSSSLHKCRGPQTHLLMTIFFVLVSHAKVSSPWCKSRGEKREHGPSFMHAGKGGDGGRIQRQCSCSTGSMQNKKDHFITLFSAVPPAWWLKLQEVAQLQGPAAARRCSTLIPPPSFWFAPQGSQMLL